jgi:hypothetical protein
MLLGLALQQWRACKGNAVLEVISAFMNYSMRWSGMCVQVAQPKELCNELQQLCNKSHHNRVRQLTQLKHAQRNPQIQMSCTP